MKTDLNRANRRYFSSRVLAFLVAVSLCNPAAVFAGAATELNPVHEIVFVGARTIDPETNLDAVRNVAVDGDKITAVSAAPLSGRRMIDAHGLIAAPGFIDMNSHASNNETAGYQAKDGVTTRLELEIGSYPVELWYSARDGHQLLNYGTSVGHTALRYFLQKGGGPAVLAELRDPNKTYSAPEAQQPIPEPAFGKLAPLLEGELRAGALGIGSGTQYAPGITRQEMFEVTAVAGRMHTCLYTHIRYGSLVEPQSTLEALQENIANAAMTGACVHIVHINSMAMSDAPWMVGLMRLARSHGVDVSTEAYPWDSSFDEVRSVMFAPGWEKRWGVGVGDLESRATGRRLTQPEFDAMRAASSGDDVVYMHMNTETTMEALMRDPFVIIASDNGNVSGPNGHPRLAANFARVLGHYVRERHVLSWAEAVRKMSFLPAQRLEAFVPEMRRKGRLQAGADADIVLFDPTIVQARATYGDAAHYSEGFRYVMVNGVLVVDGGALVPGVAPGRPIRASYGR